MLSQSLFQNVRLSERLGLHDIATRAGLITSVLPSRKVDVHSSDAAGWLALPAFVDGHVHLDKTFIGIPWVPHQGSSDVRTRIAAEKLLRREHKDSSGHRAASLVNLMLLNGTTALRTHVDIDEETRLSGLDVLLNVRDCYREQMDMQIVAFPQSGLWVSDDVIPDVEAALRAGADLIGGVDPTLIDGDAVRSLDTIFGIADRFGVGVDLHLHEPGEMGASVILGMCDRTEALGMAGKVVVSHGFCLADLDDGRLHALADRMVQAGVALMTSAPGAGQLVPVTTLSEQGVSVFTASDNIRDAWAPFGNGDMLDRAGRLAWRGDMRRDEDLRFAFDCATRKPANILGFAPRALEIGDQADFVLVPSCSIEQAICDIPTQRRVIRKGHEVARSQEPQMA